MFRTDDWWSIWLGGTVLLVVLVATWLSWPGDFDEREARYLELSRQVELLAGDERLGDEASSNGVSNNVASSGGASRENDSRQVGHSIASDRAATDQPSRGDETALARQSNDANALGKLKAERRAALRKERGEAFAALAVNPFKAFVAMPGRWTLDPLSAFYSARGKHLLFGLLGAFVLCLVLFGAGAAAMGQSPLRFAPAFAAVFLLAMLAFLLTGQHVIKSLNLEFALWAILLGLIWSNVFGAPAWLRPALRTEFYIKTGLVLFGAEILFPRLMALGLPGFFVAWIVTPIVLVSTYIFGQNVLRVPSRSLNMVISADMSVCGVSAAIATAAACRAKREELSLAIAISLGFTVVMMIAMPPFIRAVGMSEVVGGAWIGGTIDSSGAVAAAGNMLGDTALTVAVTVKMIQNILIGFVAFGVSVYWVGWVERDPAAPRVGIGEIWRRFPKFMLGFLGASFLFSILAAGSLAGEAAANAVVNDTTKPLREWMFCLAFVSIGLETNFRQLAPYFRGGKPVLLYVCGQSLNLVLTLLMAWIMFEKVFPGAARFG